MTAAEVVALPDPEWGSRLVAAVVPADPAEVRATGDAPALAEHLGDLVEQSLGRAARPRAIHIVDALPMLESGKVDRRAVLEWATRP